MNADRRRQVALIAALVAPFGLLHVFPLTEVCIGVIGVLFLADSAVRRNWSWARKPWFILACAWWAWLVFCSIPLPQFGFGDDGMSGFIESIVIIRLILFTAALQAWVFTTPAARRWGWLMLTLSLLWIGIECWQQYLTGHNIFGNPRWGDGALTGPFWKPRSGPLYAHLLFIGLLPPAMALLSRPGWLPRAGGLALTLLGMVTAVLIGQRMCVALAGLGLAIAALYLPRLRVPLLVALAAALAVLLATPIISPTTHGKLVGETERNFHHFSQSPYGEIFTVATEMGVKSPLHGWGYRSYRVDCAKPQFNTGLPALGIAPTQQALGACNLHPQNFYIQAFSDAGFPGLILFTAWMVYWTWLAARGLRRNPDPVRVGLLIGIINYTWPISSTDEFPTLYMLGWFFFFAGLALACADVAPKPPFAETENNV
jgi:O-antigen ligase